MLATKPFNYLLLLKMPIIVELLVYLDAYFSYTCTICFISSYIKMNIDITFFEFLL